MSPTNSKDINAQRVYLSDTAMKILNLLRVQVRYEPVFGSVEDIGDYTYEITPEEASGIITVFDVMGYALELNVEEGFIRGSVRWIKKNKTNFS